MKKILILVSITLGVIFTSCQKDKDPIVTSPISQLSTLYVFDSLVDFGLGDVSSNRTSYSDSIILSADKHSITALTPSPIWRSLIIPDYQVLNGPYGEIHKFNSYESYHNRTYWGNYTLDSTVMIVSFRTTTDSVVQFMAYYKKQ